jgi:hypothetical protein
MTAIYIVGGIYAFIGVLLIMLPFVTNKYNPELKEYMYR